STRTGTAESITPCWKLSAVSSCTMACYSAHIEIRLYLDKRERGTPGESEFPRHRPRRRCTGTTRCHTATRQCGECGAFLHFCRGRFALESAWSVGALAGAAPAGAGLPAKTCWPVPSGPRPPALLCKTNPTTEVSSWHAST